MGVSCGSIQTASLDGLKNQGTHAERLVVLRGKSLDQITEIATETARFH